MLRLGFSDKKISVASGNTVLAHKKYKQA